MLTYNMDIEPGSLWLRTTPAETALAQPYYCTEAGLFYGREHFNTSRSNKEVYLLFYTLEGSGVIKQNGQEVHLKKHEALLINCRTPQSYCTDPDTGRWVHYWVHFDGSGVQGMFDIINPGQKLTPVHLSKDSASSQLDVILRNLESEITESIVRDSFAIHSLLFLMAEEQLSSRQSDSSNRDRILRVASYLKSHYAEPLDTDLLTKKAGMSRSYLIALFRQYIGTTPYNYLLSCRITAAKEMLELTDLPVGEIALRTGFESQSNFSVRFQKMTGETPAGYRKNAINQTQPR